MAPGHSRRDARVRNGTHAPLRASPHATCHSGRVPHRRTPSSLDRSGRRSAVPAGQTIGIRAPRRACRRSSFSVQSGEQFAKSGNHLCRWAYVVRWSHQQIDRSQRLLLQAECFTDTALNAVTLGSCRRMLTRDQDAEPRFAAIASRQVEGIAGETAPRSIPQQTFEFAAAPKAALGIQSEALARRGYNPRRRRPRARRLRKTLRPPGVRLRTRKPWRRARRVFDGW